jgi:peptidyl-prolyl cis-trans isomerase C
MKKEPFVNSFTKTKCLAVVLCSVALFACQGTPGSSSGPKHEGQVLAEVNGAKITTGDFNREVKNLPEYLRAMADTPQGRREMLDTMVIRELILQKASKDGLDKGPELEEKLQELKKRLIVESFLKKKVETDAKISDADLKKFYDQHIDKFKTGEQIRASHILVKNEQTAKELLAQIRKGASFEELARKNSVDSSAAKGGDLGWFNKGAMVPVFEKAALALKEGQVSDVVKSDFGFHIIKLTGKRPAGTRPFEEVKDQIKAALLPTKQQEIFQKIKEELKKSAKVTVKEDALNAMDGKKSEPAKPAAPEKKPEKK